MTLRGRQRTVRMTDDLWNRFTAKAEARGETASELIRRWVEDYAVDREPGAPSPFKMETRMTVALAAIVLDVDAQALWNAMGPEDIPLTLSETVEQFRAVADQVRDQAGRV